MEARRQNSETMNRPILSGGIGGAGGKGSSKGGNGGVGEVPQLPEHLFREFEIIGKLFSMMRGGLYSQFHQGGVGGFGGKGSVEDGLDGIGEEPKFMETVVSMDGSTIYVPKLTVAEFCQEYKLSEEIYKLLTHEGFETAGSLLKTSDITLKAAKLETGQIVELKRALKEFVAKGPARL
ncbi:hypothetical protein B0H19DRAFT_1380873 [Mycena capillaripes]|nr:hypothetical protein B0H19DRAFT_1380873 [Mycena capillaripes]